MEADYYRTFGKKKDIVIGVDVDIPPVDTDLYQHFTEQFIEGSVIGT
ncbi:MAG: hypothetical protein IPN13_07235 [Bacteroidetes bacterium]|nr:hypothetical protein [Bacteroidota bacterium]